MGLGPALVAEGEHVQRVMSLLWNPKQDSFLRPCCQLPLSPPRTKDTFPESRPGESASLGGDLDIRSPKGAVDGACLAGSQAPPWHQKTCVPGPRCSGGPGAGRLPGPSEPPLQKEGVGRAAFLVCTATAVPGGGFLGSGCSCATLSLPF